MDQLSISEYTGNYKKVGLQNARKTSKLVIKSSDHRQYLTITCFYIRYVATPNYTLVSRPPKCYKNKRAGGWFLLPIILSGCLSGSRKLVWRSTRCKEQQPYCTRQAQVRPDERETKIMTNNEKECGTLRSVRAVDGKLKCNLEWPKCVPLVFTAKPCANTCTYACAYLE